MRRYKTKYFKYVWLTLVISYIISFISLFFLPEKIPGHYDIYGNVTRMGSKYEIFVGAIASTIVTLFLFILSKKQKNDTEEITKDKIKENSKIDIINIMSNIYFILFTIQGVLSAMDIIEFRNNTLFSIMYNVFVLSLGILCLRIEKNETIGFRTKWTMYNEITWKKSNSFAGIILIIVSIANIFISLFILSRYLIIYNLSTLILSVFISLIYSRFVYNSEISR